MIQDIVREINKNALEELRRMRAFVNAHSFGAMSERCRELGEQLNRAKTAEDEKKWLDDWAAFLRDDEMKKFYTTILICAESEERKQKGGGAAFYRQFEKNIRRAEDLITKGYMMQNGKWVK